MASLKAISKQASLDILCYAGFHMSYPSWMLAWEPSGNVSLIDPLKKTHWIWYVEPRRRWAIKNNPHRVRKLGTQYSFLNKQQKFHAARDTSAKAIIGQKLLNKGEYLLVQGVCIGHIASLIDYWGIRRSYEIDWDFNSRMKSSHKIISSTLKKLKLSVTENAPKYVEETYNWLGSPEHMEMAKRIKKLYHIVLAIPGPSFISSSSSTRLATKAERIEQLWRTLIFNRVADGFEAPHDTYLAFDVLINNGRGVPDSFLADSGLSYFHRARLFVQPLMRNLAMVLLTRSLFVSQRGMLVLGNAWAQEGDRVCVFFGCHCPMLVAGWRQKSGEGERREDVFETVSHGSAYVHGYMAGRAIDELDIGKVKVETFKLW